MKVHRLRIFTACLLSIMLMAGCSSNSASNTPLEQPPAEEVVVPEETESTEELSAYRAALTGLPIEEESTVRPLAVMINNAPAARPQSGLTEADVIYEVLAEGGITRLVAIFQSNNTDIAIGPIRSIRPYLIDIGDSYSGILVHAGGSPAAYGILQKQKKADMDEIGNAGSYFWRESSRKAPHNLYSSVQKLREGADKLGYSIETELPLMTFREPEEVVIGDEAKKIDVQFLLQSYKVTYEYDEESKLYNRFMNDEAHIDLNTNEQLKAANVVVLGADHKVLDDVGRLSVDLTTGGDALLFQRGKVLEGRWIHKADDIIRFVVDNEEIPLFPGTTYYNIVPNTPDFKSHVIIDGGAEG